MIEERDNEAATSGELLADPAYIEELRRQMVKFAQLQLSDGHAAEDAVQEALVGAMAGVKRFAGRAALKTWVFAILKNKIADALRQKQRLIDASSLLREGEEEEDFSELFDKRGHWRSSESPVPWREPEDAFSQGQFWTVFEACLEGLPAKQARIFMMREFVELESEEICAAAEISMSNLFVVLHRARLRLRECLENNWFLREV